MWVFPLILNVSHFNCHFILNMCIQIYIVHILKHVFTLPTCLNKTLGWLSFTELTDSPNTYGNTTATTATPTPTTTTKDHFSNQQNQ